MTCAAVWNISTLREELLIWIMKEEECFTFFFFCISHFDYGYSHLLDWRIISIAIAQVMCTVQTVSTEHALD